MVLLYVPVVSVVLIFCHCGGCSAAYFKEPGCPFSDELEETVMALQTDKDRDVRFFATLDPNKALMDTAPLI
jgi:hypothetical protein